MYSVQKENQDPRSTHHHCPNSIDPDSVVCAVTIFTQYTLYRKRIRTPGLLTITAHTALILIVWSVL